MSTLKDILSVCCSSRVIAGTELNGGLPTCKVCNKPCQTITRLELKARKMVEKERFKTQRAIDRAKVRAERLKLRTAEAKERADNTIPKLKDRLWRITSKIVRRRAGENCYTCGKYTEPKKREAGHYWTKGGHGAAAFDFRNLRMQCHDCNYWDHGNLAEYQYYLRREIGDKEFDDLRVLAHTQKDWQREELQALIAERRAILKSLSN